jgi:hypothetical protein
MSDEVTLTIVGGSGARVRVVPRDRGDDPPADLFNGEIGANGEISLKLPRGYYVVLGERHTVPADFSDGTSWKRIAIGSE